MVKKHMVRQHVLSEGYIVQFTPHLLHNFSKYVEHKVTWI